VIPDTGKDALHARELYAWLQLEQKEKNTAVADSLLNELLTYYGQTMYAEQARRYFAVHKTVDSRGESAYSAAYRTLKNSGIETAKPQFMDVVYGYEKEDVAPRALYAIGLTYEDTRLYDSALTYYRRVLRDYPYSSYAVALRARMPDIAQGITRSAARPVDPNTPFGTTEDPAKLEERQKQEAERARKQREEELRRQQRPLPGSEDTDSTSTEVPVGQNPPGQPPPGDAPPGQQPPMMPPQIGPDGRPIPPLPQMGPDGKPLPPQPIMPPPSKR
jgi:tetratricopeptide (TPR) repeat protein